MTKTPATILAAVLALLVVAAPTAACLAMVQDAPAVEHAPMECDPSSENPSATWCADSGTVIPPDGSASPLVGAADTPSSSGPEGIRPLDSDRAVPSDLAPRARSAPIHLLHATFLI